MLISDRPAADVAALRTRLHGAVYGPSDAGYDEARRPWNLAVDQRPAAVAFPVTDADVQAIVAFAREQGLRVTPQATGHGASANGPLEATILVHTKHMRGVRIDPVNRTARVRAGALWQDVTAPAAIHGLAPLAGSAGDVGIVGYMLGGGLSWLGRAHGLACNSITAIELVTADAQAIRVDRDHDPELFWALRGGNTHPVGIVTALEFDLFAVDQLHGGALVFPGERAERDLRRLARVDADRPGHRDEHLPDRLPARPARDRPRRGRDPRRRRDPASRCATCSRSPTRSAR